MKRKVIISSLIILFLIILTNNCQAAISATSKTVNSGENVSITITSNPGVAAYTVNMTNAGGLTFVSCSGGEVGGTSVTNAKSENMTTLATYNFKVPNVTVDTKYTVSFSATGMETANLEPVANSSTKATITVKAPVATPDPAPSTPSTPSQPTEPATPTKPVEDKNASVAILKDLGITPKEYDFSGFAKNPNKEEWDVKVPNEVSEVSVYAKANYSGTVSGTGTKKLNEGTNILKVTVTSKDGTNSKIYKIRVTRDVASAEITPNTSEDVGDSTGEQNTIGLSKLEVKGMNLTPEFAVDTYRYIVELEDEEITTLEQIKELITAEVNFEGGTFEITGEEKLEKEENEVVVSVKDADGREIAIYTLVFKMKKVEDTSDTVAETTGIIENEKTTFDKDKIIIIASIIIISIIALKSSITSYKQRKILQANGLIKVKEYDEEEFIEEEENRLEENNEIIEEEKIIENEPSEENKNDYIKDIFENNQMEFNPDDKDFIKKKRGKGKHS